MRSGSRSRRGIGLLVAALIGMAGLPAMAQAPAAGGTSEEWIKKLAAPATEPDIDLAELKKQAAERIKSKAEPVPNKRPLVAPELTKLPQFVAEILFDDDVAVVRPDSYRTLGRIADDFRAGDCDFRIQLEHRQDFAKAARRDARAVQRARIALVQPL